MAQAEVHPAAAGLYALREVRNAQGSYEPAGVEPVCRFGGNPPFRGEASSAAQLPEPEGLHPSGSFYIVETIDPEHFLDGGESNREAEDPIVEWEDPGDSGQDDGSGASGET